MDGTERTDGRTDRARAARREEERKMEEKLERARELELRWLKRRKQAQGGTGDDDGADLDDAIFRPPQPPE